MLDREELIDLMRMDFKEAQIKCRVAPKNQDRTVLIYSPHGKEKAPWASYTEILRDRNTLDFLYDDVSGNLYWPDGTLGKRGKWKMGVAVLLSLGQNTFRATDAEIAADLNIGQNSPEAAVRQAIARINKKVDRLILSSGEGYELNPALAWRMVRVAHV